MDNNIVEKMKKSDTWDNIVEKMKKSDTWDAIGKDLGPYLDEVLGRMKAFDESILKDFYILELRRWIHRIRKWLIGHTKFSQVSSEIRDEHKKWVEGMRAEDNSCSSTRANFQLRAPSDLHDEDYKSLVCSQVNVTKPQASLAADASKTEVKRKMSGFSSIKQLCSKFHQITNHAQDTSLHADSISLIQEGTTKLLYYVAPQVVECINTVKISQVHVAASECLLEITKLYRTHITVQSEEVSFIGVIHLCEVEKNETAKSSLRKCIKTLESLKRENISTD